LLLDIIVSRPEAITWTCVPTTITHPGDPPLPRTTWSQPRSRWLPKQGFQCLRERQRCRCGHCHSHYADCCGTIRQRDRVGCLCDRWDGKQLHGLNASGRSPAGWTPERFAGLDAMPMLGWESVTVPGAVSAWVKLSERFGKLEFETLFEPAIHYAEPAFPSRRSSQRCGSALPACLAISRALPRHSSRKAAPQRPVSTSAARDMRAPCAS
jgi:hypothetical protein